MKNLIEQAKEILVEKISQDELNNLLDAMRGFEGNLKEVTFINNNKSTHRFKFVSKDFDVLNGNPILYFDKEKSRIILRSDKIKSYKFVSGGTKVTVEFES